jgi:hypothetical protein
MLYDADSHLPPIDDIYAEMTRIERERREVRALLKLALDRRDLESKSPTRSPLRHALRQQGGAK